jgi:hypothetical protein
MIRLASAVVLALIARIGTASSQPTTQTIGNQLACNCRIRVGSTLVLGSPGDTILTGQPVAVRVDQRGRHWVNPRDGAPIIFGPNGKFIRLLGPKGVGPGEFVGAADIAYLPGDSILVMDARSQRATIVGPDLSVRRSIAMPYPFTRAVAVKWPEVIANGIVPTPDGVGLPLHIASFGGDQVKYLKSFGPQKPVHRAGTSPTMLAMIIDQAPNGSVWAADRVRYRLSEWGVDGTIKRILTRDALWFADSSDGGLGSPTRAPPPVIGAMNVDRDGLLWVFTNVAAKTWPEAWPAKDRNSREVGANSIQTELLYDTMVEVIEPSQRRLLAQQKLPGFVLSALPGRRIAVYGADSQGFPQISIVSLILDR